MDPIAEKFHGTWKFVSAIQTLADGTTRPSPAYAVGGVGYLLYTPQGRMMVFIMDPARPRWASPASPTENELRSAMKGFLSYGGRYEVNAAEGFVLHHVEIDPVPNRVGTILKRYFEFTGNRLILRAAPPLPAGVVDYAITWERIPD